MVGRSQAVATTVLAKDPNVDACPLSNVGGDGQQRLNMGSLKPRNQRALTADQVIRALRPKLARFPGIRVFLTRTRRRSGSAAA